jgi:hypothetical protein
MISDCSRENSATTASGDSSPDGSRARIVRVRNLFAGATSFQINHPTMSRRYRAGGAYRAAARFAEPIMKQRKHRSRREVEMRHTFRRRPSSRGGRLTPGLTRQPAMQHPKTLLYRLQVLDDPLQLRIHGAGL